MPRTRAAIPIPVLLAGLDRSYPEPEGELSFHTPFQALVAVMLSAQMTDAGVNRVTGALFARFPTAARMARADVGEVEQLIRSVNYYRTKARHLVAAAQLLTREFRGEPPRSIDELLRLPGVGRKTANVVLVAAYNTAEGIGVDTHVGRVARRTGLSRHTDPAKVERDLLRKIPRASWASAHHQLVLLGRYVCVARAPKCGACVFQDACPSSTAR